MKDYYCTKTTLDLIKQFTPETLEDEIKVLYDEEDSELIPLGYKVIRSEMNDTRYIVSLKDFLADSLLQEVPEDQLLTIEHFENGLPNWLAPIPGLRIYLADWDGQEWQFTKVSGI